MLRAIEHINMPSSDGTDSCASALSSRPEVELLRSQVASLLEKYPAYNTTHSLQRWLNGYNCNVDKAAEKLKWALVVLDALGALRNYENAEELNDYLRSLNACADHVPGGVMGTDRQGNILSINPIGLSRPRALVHYGRVSDLYRASIIEAEACMYFLRREEAIRERKLNIIIIVDMHGFSMETMYMPAIKIYLNVLHLMQMIFPDTVKKVFVINAPTAVNVLYGMAKNVLSKRTVENVEFLDTDWKIRLQKEFGPENIFEHWGGAKSASTPTGTIRMGGEVPPELSLRLIKNLKRLPDEQLKKTSIQSGDCAEIPIYVDESDSRMYWYFEVWPRFCISTEFVAEYGDIICKSIGTYTLHFHSRSSFFSKDILYSISVAKQPERVISFK